MNTDKTLADVQPGGRVRLGDAATIEQRARELLAAEFKGAYLLQQDILLDRTFAHDPAIRAIIAALTPSDGHVVVTRNEAGQAVAVTRQDDEGRILSVIAEFEAPEGYVLIRAEALNDLVADAELYVHGTEFRPNCIEQKLVYVREAKEILASRPGVKP
ncbi:hypothetical protein LRM36_05380 [Stenotrophomonas maltophilia]|nr:hypothetical protein [Stenotrophomonas maltophilia]